MSVGVGGNAALGMMRDSLAETRKRQAAAVTGGGSTLDTDPDYNRPFFVPEQKYMLWNITNANLMQKTPRAAFRILGLFPSQETALEHARSLACNTAIRLATTHEWLGIPVSEHEAYADWNQLKVTNDLEAHTTMLQQHALEFNQRHDMLTKGRKKVRFAEEAQAAKQLEDDARTSFLNAGSDPEKVKLANLEVAERELNFQQRVQQNMQDANEWVDEIGCEESKVPERQTTTLVSSQFRPESITSAWSEHALTGASYNDRLPITMELRGQRFISVGVLRDSTCADVTDPVGLEPSIIVFGAFDTEDEAKKYNRCVASKHVRDHDLGVTRMYEWEFPHTMFNSNIDQLYRNDVLDSIMRHKRNAARQVKEFELLAQSKGETVNPIEIEPDLSEPAPIWYKRPIESDGM